MKRIFSIVAGWMVVLACSRTSVEVDFLGPLQGENSGQPTFAYQGMDIWGDYMVSCQNQGIATVYSLSKDGFAPEGQFHLASFHEYNHANVASFGVEKVSPQDPLPVIYISQCHKKTVDGRKDLLYAERIAADFSGSSLVQTIFYDDVNSDFGYALQWVVDQKHRMLYGYGNTVDNSSPFNSHRIIKFRLPSLSEGPEVVLKPEDALENYLLEEVSGFRFNPVGQGLYIRKGKLYMPTGVGKAETPSILFVWDLEKRSMRSIDLSLLTTGEFEDISFYKGRFYIQGQDGIFRIRLGRDAGMEGFDWHALVPAPVYDARPEYLELYDKAWNLAYQHIDTIPGIPSPLYMDEAHRSDRIWVWDSAFMGHFCKYCPSVFPGVKSLDNFYKILLSDAETPLPLVKGNVYCGKDEGKMLPLRIQHADNPPLLAWTEYCYAMQTGSLGRLKRLMERRRYLQRWYEMFDAFDPEVKPHGANQKVMLRKYPEGYAWGGCPSGMDNTPRGRSSAPTDRAVCPDNPDLRWVDALSQQGLSALYMSRIAGLLGLDEQEKEWSHVHEELSAKLNELYWDEEDAFYYDILPDGQKCKVQTVASWWPLLAGMAEDERASAMIAHLSDSSSFGGFVPTVSLSRSDADFIEDGGYWRGSVWIPTSYMVLKGVDAQGEYGLAREIGKGLLEHIYRTYRDFEPHTIWECYSPSSYEPAMDKKAEFVRHDFCGWSALGPISVFIEDVIGIKEADGFTRTLVCDFGSPASGRVGVRGYRFGDVVCNIIADEKTIDIDSNRPFTLIADGKSLSVNAGKNNFHRN
ncbi:MAG: hypothetical protein IKR69_06520 [Bacteroidales bacterium]|nr:hypothetical protein [Bacteroidales bacterium]